MLYWLTLFSDGGDFFNLFRYITFRSGGAFMTALVFGFIFGRPLINVLRKRQGKGQPIRTDGPEGHITKSGTPTMGGLLIVGALMTSSLLWARLDNAYVWMVLFVTGVPLLLVSIIGIGYLRTTGHRTPFGGNQQRGMLDPDFQEARRACAVWSLID